MTQIGKPTKDPLIEIIPKRIPVPDVPDEERRVTPLPAPSPEPEREPAKVK